MSTTTYHVTAQRADSFTRKQISVTFDIDLGGGGTDSLTLSESHRIRATISHAGIGIGTELLLTIEGMTLNEMNRLSYIANYPNAQNPQTTNQSNTMITVRAGTVGKILKSVFIGNLEEAWADFDGGSAVFHVKARTITTLAQINPEPISFKGARSIPSIISDICMGQGVSLTDHGGWKGAVLKNHYAAGSFPDLIDEIMKASGGVYDFRRAIAGQNTTETVGNIGTLHIWGPHKKNEKTDTTPLISAKTGLIGYPKYIASGISLKCLFRDELNFYEPIEVESAYIPAGWSINSQGMNQAGQQIGGQNAPWNGLWLPITISHDLSSESIGAPWLTSLECQITNWDQPYAIKG